MPWLMPEEILRVPSESLGISILHRLTEVGGNQLHLKNFTNEYLFEQRERRPYVTTVYKDEDLRDDHAEVVEKLADAWSWLELQRYLGPDPRQDPGWVKITRRGKEVLEMPVDRALERIKAGNLLGSDLHPRIEAQARRAWNEGDFATAIFNSAREVEIAVGEQLPQQKRKPYGVDVANLAFGSGKPLTDPNQDPGEQEGTRALFAGFIATFKNPGSHRHFEPDDPVQAAEIIRTADLLIRILEDRVSELNSPAAKEAATTT